MTDPAQTSLEYAAAFAEEMRRAGVRHVCISPGSRSTPLALAIASNPGLRTWIHLDERSSAFFALGIARALDEPVAIVCTSGTAAANFFPAVVEARSAAVPLLVLTADRPPELRDVGAAQTIDQNRLYGAHAKWFVEVALPETSPEMLRYVRTLASRAASNASEAPAGPVHLNFPFREPLVPSELASPKLEGRADGAAWVSVTRGQRMLDAKSVEKLARRLSSAKRPIIVCGPQPDQKLAIAVTQLAEKMRAPVLADPLSQLRWGAHPRDAIIDRYDAVLRHEKTAGSLAPDLVVRIGGAPTSKALLQFLQRHTSAPLIVIAESQWPDPTLLAEEMVRATPRAACEQLANPVRSSADGDWLDRWKTADRIARTALEQHACAVAEAFEGAALADVASVLPDGAALFVSSSMPVRDLDAFASGDSRSIRVMANRGANGIDGVVSTALGAAAAIREDSGSPLVLVIGDLALYHDMNGLLAAKLHDIPATIVLLNNDGGGIFSFLPQAQHPEHFEKLFGTPHGLEFEPVADLYGAHYERADDSASLRRAVASGIARGGLNIIEMQTERRRNVELHREAWAQVAAGLDTI